MVRNDLPKTTKETMKIFFLSLWVFPLYTKGFFVLFLQVASSDLFLNVSKIVESVTTLSIHSNGEL